MRDKDKIRLICEVDLKCKKARFFTNSRHLMTCYPDVKMNKSSVYRYISGDFKKWNNHHYFFFDIDAIPLEDKTIASMQNEALEIARAQLKQRNIIK